MSHGNVIELSDGELPSRLSGSGGKLVVVDFTATWCGPCKAIAPLFVDLSNQHKDVVFLKVDVDKCRGTAQQCGIAAMPTFHFYINSKKVAEFSGGDPNKLKQYVEKYKPAQSFTTQGQALGHGPAPSAPKPVAAPVNNNEPDPVMVKELLEMGFPVNRAKKALLVVKNSSAQAAMDWIFENMENPEIDEPFNNNSNNNNNNSSTSTTSTSSPTVHNALCDICTKQIIGIRYKCSVCPNYDMCQDCKAAGTHPADHECVAHEKDIENYQMTPEERALQRKKLEDKIQEVRRKKQEDEAKRDIEREITRRSSGKEQQDSVRKWQDEQIRKEAEKQRKEKEDELRAKEKIKKQLEQDRLERIARKNGTAAAAAPTPIPAPAVVAAPISIDSYSQVTIQIRLPSGNAVRGTFKPTDTLSAIYSFLVDNNHIVAPFKLSNTYPRKIFDQSELKTVTLVDAGLVPNGSLLATK